MARITSYPTVTPAAGDLVLLSDVSGTNNPTKTATASSIAELAEFSFEKTSLTTAQIGQLNTTPITLVAAPGAGKVLIPISVVIRYNYGTAGMTGNRTLDIMQKTASLYQWSNVLDDTSTSIRLASDVSNDAVLSENQALKIQVPSGDPTVGASTSTVDVYVYYRTLTL
tara:strand:+ start:592 stop:1098 length:507 start_codon:yes stop_codon:yes gene_type:complete